MQWRCSLLSYFSPFLFTTHSLVYLRFPSFIRAVSPLQSRYIMHPDSSAQVCWSAGRPSLGGYAHADARLDLSTFVTSWAPSGFIRRCILGHTRLLPASSTVGILMGGSNRGNPILPL